MTPTNRAGPLVFPGNEEKRATREEIRRHEIEIDELKTAIQVLGSQQLQMDCDEERVSPVLLDERYAHSLSAPIRGLPAEILAEIFLVATIVYRCSALRLMRVCRSWRSVLLTTSRIWSTIRVRTRTRADFVEFLVERTRRVTLDVEIDTDSDSEPHISDPSRSFTSLAVVAETSARWRNLTIHSFPKEPDLTNSGVLGTGLTFEGPMDALESFRITGPCEMSTALSELIELVRCSKGSQFTTLELSTCDALYHFAKPPSSRFRYLHSFKVDLAEMKDTLDILPQFERLEHLYAHRLQLPLYSETTHLPLLRTLKRLFLKSTSVQWMQGRSFSKLLECTIIWPHLPEALLSRGPVNLPVCTQFTYDDHLLQPLTAFNLPSVDKLVIRNEAWNRPRGSQQLGFIWGPNIHRKVLSPRVLHLDTQCFDQHLISALKMIPEVEELVLGLVRPDALGKKFLLSMLAKKGRGASTSANTTWIATLCPHLRILGLKYRRWLRNHEADEITPILRRIVETRAKSATPLRSFKFWPTKDTEDEDAKELVHG
jgi:hypothetical protein